MPSSFLRAPSLQARDTLTIGSVTMPQMIFGKIHFALTLAALSVSSGLPALAAETKTVAEAQDERLGDTCIRAKGYPVVADAGQWLCEFPCGQHWHLQSDGNATFAVPDPACLKMCMDYIGPICRNATPFPRDPTCASQRTDPFLSRGARCIG